MGINDYKRAIGRYLSTYVRNAFPMFAIVEHAIDAAREQDLPWVLPMLLHLYTNEPDAIIASKLRISTACVARLLDNGYEYLGDYFANNK